jgi:RND family efflux transporter MFP subunit
MRPTQAIQLSAAAAAFALVFAVGCGSNNQEAAPEAKAPDIVRTATMRVSPEDVETYYTAPGTVAAEFTSTLSTKVMGRVQNVAVVDGQSVSQGQSLISLDSRELDSAIKMADANRNASIAGLSNAETALTMERANARARIAGAEAGLRQARSALAAAKARLDLTLAGPRSQEKVQAKLAVTQAASALKLAQTELDRTRRLVEDGALAARQLDVATNAYELAKANYESAVQAESIATEGARAEEIRGARQAVQQANGAVMQAQAGLTQAKAAALQVGMRIKEIASAQAQVRQSDAALASAKVTASYSSIVAPFDGWVAKRMVDPGAMAAPGVPLITVEGGSYRMEASVPESVLRYVKLGNKASVQVDSLDKSFDATVIQVLPKGSSASRTFTVRYQLPRDSSLRSGMFARAKIRTGVESVVTVPKQSIQDREGLHYVFALDKDRIVHLRVVTLGDPVGDRIKVLTGISSGDEIVVGDLSQVRDGVKVEGGQ